MDIEQIDHYCDLYEERLKSGDELSAEQFLREYDLTFDQSFFGELEKLEREYRRGSPNNEGESTPTVGLTDVMPSESIGTFVGS